MTKTKVQTIFLTAFLLFSVITLANPSLSFAASPIGIVNYDLLFSRHPDTAQADAAYQAAAKEAQDEFTAKSAKMNDQDKRALGQQLEQTLMQKREGLLNAIRVKIDAAIKEVADAKGMTTVVDKRAVVYGGQDITDEVLQKIGAGAK